MATRLVGDILTAGRPEQKRKEGYERRHVADGARRHAGRAERNAARSWPGSHEAKQGQRIAGALLQDKSGYSAPDFGGDLSFQFDDEPCV